MSESHEPYLLRARQWDNGVAVEDGIPFHTIKFGMILGNPGDQSFLVDWAEQAARFREDPMVPADDPFAAVEELIKQLQRAKGESENPVSFDTLNHLRMQVVRSIAQLPGVSPADVLSESGDSGAWQALRDKCRSMNLRWDGERQAYAADSAEAVPGD